MNKRLVIGGLVVIVVIAAGLYFGLPKFSNSTAAAQAVKPERVMVIAVEQEKNGQRFGGEVQIRFSDPPALPERAEEASGLFLGKDSQELILGTGSIEVEITIEVTNDEEPNTVVNATYGGEEVQIAVDEDTIYYRDATELPELTEETMEAGQLQLIRVLEKGSLAKIDENMMVRAWGEFIDGSLVADLIVYDPIR